MLATPLALFAFSQRVLSTLAHYLLAFFAITIRYAKPSIFQRLTIARKFYLLHLLGVHRWRNSSEPLVLSMGEFAFKQLFLF